MNWLFFAILSPAIYALVNFVDKYILSKYIKDYRGMSMFSAVMAVIFGTSFWFFGGRPILSIQDAILIIFSGAFTFWAMVLYFKALSSDDTSNIIILFQMGPVIVLLLSWIFLKEKISISQLIGFFMVLLASIGISINKFELKLKISNSLFLIFLNQILWSLGAILFKFVVDQNSFVKVVSYESWGIALGGAVLFVTIPNIRNPFLDTFKTLKKKALIFVFTNEGLFVIARLLGFLAISMGPVALVSVMGSTSVFFGIFFGAILTIILPSVFNEGLSKDTIAKKVLCGILVFIGIWLIY